MTTFGKAISDERKSLRLSLRELAERVKKEDGASISPQYLNDIEHGRRNPPPAYIIRQLAEELGFEFDYLLVLSNELPAEDQELVRGSEPQQVHRALEAFRKTLREG